MNRHANRLIDQLVGGPRVNDSAGISTHGTGSRTRVPEPEEITGRRSQMANPDRSLELDSDKRFTERAERLTAFELQNE